MKILVLSFYYKPDLCAGSFRATALVDQLAHSNVSVDVVTTAPNRYASFEVKAPKVERSTNVAVHRVKLPSHQSGMVDQIKAFIAYYNGAQALVKKSDYDIVFATSSRLFTAFLGARIAKRKKLPLYLDIRDIFADTMGDILPTKIAWFIKPLLSLIERYTFAGAKRINLVSQGFSSYFEARYRKVPTTFFTNGIDEEFMEVAPSPEQQSRTAPRITVLYAGNIGAGQGLHKIIPELALRLKDSVDFRIIGDGGKKNEFKAAISKLELMNVQLLPPLGRGDLIKEYCKSDVLFLHLDDVPAFEKVLPSKLFEYAAMGKPIWAGLGGYSSNFACSEITNCEVFAPGNCDDAVEKFAALDLNEKRRGDFVKKFSRKAIMEKMAQDVLEVANNHD